MVGILRFLPHDFCLLPCRAQPGATHPRAAFLPLRAPTRHRAPWPPRAECTQSEEIWGRISVFGQRSHRASYQYRGAAWPRGARSTQGTPPPLAGVPRCGQPRSRGASLARNATRHQAHEGGRAHTHRHATPSSRRRLGHSQRPQLQLSRATARSEPRDQPRVPALLHECARGVCHSPRPNLAERSAQFSN